MFERKRFRWKVTLHTNAGETAEAEFEAYWSPDWEGIKEAVGQACAIREWHRSGKKVNFSPALVEQVT